MLFVWITQMKGTRTSVQKCASENSKSNKFICDQDMCNTIFTFESIYHSSSRQGFRFIAPNKGMLQHFMVKKCPFFLVFDVTAEHAFFWHPNFYFYIMKY